MLILAVLILMLLAYLIYLDHQERLLYKTRSTSSKVAEVLAGMGIIFVKAERSGIVKTYHMDLCGVSFYWEQVGIWRTHLFLKDDSKDAQKVAYGALPYFFRNTLYLRYLQKRYPKCFDRIKLDVDQRKKRMQKTKIPWIQEQKQQKYKAALMNAMDEICQ